MFNVFSMIDSYGAVDKWLSTLNKQAKGSVVTGYKAERLTFTGSATEVRQQSAFKLFQQAEGNLMYREYTDHSRGDITISSSNLHAAIAGEGYFLVTDGKGKFFYSRDGEFQRDEAGVLVNQSGLYVVDQAMALSLPAANFTYTPPAVTATSVNDGTAGWQNGVTTGFASLMGGGYRWFPYVAGTNWDEGGANRYTNQSIYAKRTFFVNNTNTPTGSLTCHVGDLAYVIVNGTVINPFSPTQMSPTNVANAQRPVNLNDATPTTFDISPYLKPGANTIVFKCHEFEGGEGLKVTGTIAGQNFTEADFAYKVAVTTPDVTLNPNAPNHPVFANSPTNTIYQDYTGFGLSPDDWDAIYGNAKDVLLVNGPTDKAEFEATMYGNTVFDWPTKPTNITVQHPGQGGTGNLVFNALEASNVKLQQLAPEIAMAQQMYSNLKTVLQLKKSNFDLIMAAVK